MRPFTDVLRDMRKGKVVAEATDRLAELVMAVLETGKPGTLSLQLSVRTQSRGDNAVIVAAKVGVKKPQLDLPEALFFADGDGALLRDDPTQMRMFAEAGVDPDTGEVREPVLATGA